MAEISVSLLNVNKEKATRTFYDLETAKINYFHIDIMDGKFVEKNTVEIMKDYALTISHISNLGLDVHLMVENVEEFIDEYSMLEPEIITFHIEATKTEERTKNAIEEIKNIGSRVGIAISPETNIDEIKPYLPYVHTVLVMTVVPGKGGQKLIPETLEKVRALKQYIDENNIDIDIEVDGGINDQTSKEALEAGANIMVVGTYLVNSDNFNEAVKKLK
jgi:ribulose-phosphate 3-epimerase